MKIETEQNRTLNKMQTQEKGEDECGEDEVTRLEEVLKSRKSNLNGLTFYNITFSCFYLANGFLFFFKGVNTKFNIFSNRNSFYFRSKLNCYNNKLRDLKTNQLIPSFNYFFLKPSNDVSQKVIVFFNLKNIVPLLYIIR